jgi:hypothetical protein
MAPVPAEGELLQRDPLLFALLLDPRLVLHGDLREHHFGRGEVMRGARVRGGEPVHLHGLLARQRLEGQRQRGTGMPPSVY